MFWFEPKKINRNRYMKKLLLAGAFLLATMSGYAQVKNHSCGTDEHLQSQMEAQPELKIAKERFETNIREAMKNYNPENYKTKPGSQKKSGKRYIIPVVVHVFHANGNENISDARINAEIAYLNSTFNNLDPDSTFRRKGFFVTSTGDTNYYDYKSLAADSEVEFRLAKKDPQGNCTNGIVRVFTPLTSKGNDDLKKTSVWDTKRYFNIWLVREINRGNSVGIAGYAQFPFGPGGGASTDGIMVLSSLFGVNDETTTHEVGHWLGLYHPFQISSDSCGIDGDGVMDTPPTYFVASVTEPLRNRCNNPNFNTCSTEKPDLPDMQENYMDYYNGNCASNMFTLEQKARMHYVLDSIRIPIWSVPNLIATGVDGPPSTPCPPVAAFNSPGRTICGGNRAQFIDFSYGGTITTYEWTFEGGEPATFTGKTPPQILFNSPGQYDVSLKVTGPNGTTTSVLKDYITVLPASSQLPAGYYTADWWYQNNYEEKGWVFEHENPFNKFRRFGVSYNQNVSMLYPRDPFNINKSVGTLSSLISPAFDFTGQSNAYFSFNYAFAQGTLGATLGGGNTKDELKVYTSVDCGRTWISRVTYSDGGTNRISTIGTGAAGTLANSIDFIPADQSKWKTVTLSGGQIPNSNNVRFKIEFKYQGGNNFYLDNVQTGLTTGLSNENLAEAIGFSVQPNPFNVNTNLHYDLRNAEEVSIRVMDILGKDKGMVFEGIQQAGTQTVEISKNAMQLIPGMYLVQVKIGQNSFTQKIIVE